MHVVYIRGLSGRQLCSGWTDFETLMTVMVAGQCTIVDLIQQFGVRKMVTWASTAGRQPRRISSSSSSSSHRERTTSPSFHAVGSFSGMTGAEMPPAQYRRRGLSSCNASLAAATEYPLCSVVVRPSSTVSTEWPTHRSPRCRCFSRHDRCRRQTTYNRVSAVYFPL